MMKQDNVSASASVRPSRVQVEVREIPTVRKQAAVRHDVDSDGGDISNE